LLIFHIRIEWEDRNTADFFAYLSWQLTRTNRNGIPISQKTLDTTHPVQTPNFKLLESFHDDTLNQQHQDESENDGNVTRYIDVSSNPSSTTTRVPVMTCTWLGQSTVYIQMDGYTVLTDPIFSSRTTGDWVGPKRIQRVPCTLSQLPRPDLVLVSHNHYDHLDRGVVRELGDSVLWVVPCGLKVWFEGLGVSNVRELDWWEEYIHEGKLKIIGTPIQVRVHLYHTHIGTYFSYFSVFTLCSIGAADTV
jgi:N-acyl-phosphatidylethanolamine-hydrolysing phospholipase D